MKISEMALDQLFRDARTHAHWLDKPVPSTLLEELYDLWKWGPTSANSSPARVIFVTTEQGKARLLPHVDEGNRDKTKAAPATAIIAYDTLFYNKLDKLFPHDASAPSWFEGEEHTGNETAFRNSSLQGAYFMFAARSLGLDCGPMSGFDKEALDKEFFPAGTVKSNFLCNVGYGDTQKLYGRLPRLSFDECCMVI